MKIKMSDQAATTGSILGTVMTVWFWIFSQLSSSQAATIVTVVAGLSTIAVNYQKYRINKRKNKSK